MPDPDPRQHLLSTRRYEWNDSGAAVSWPVTFTERVAVYRESMAGAPGASRGPVTGAEALAAAALLKEFAARLRHDIARGAVDPDAEHLAQVAADLAVRMREAGGLAG